MEEEDVLNLEEDVLGEVATAKKKRQVQPTLAHLFRFSKVPEEKQEPKAGKSKTKKAKKKQKEEDEGAEPKKKKKKKESMVIESDEEEDEQADEDKSKRKKKKAKEKIDLSHLGGPVDLAKATVAGTMRAVAGDHPVAKDSAIVAMECARLFVHHLAACTNDLAKQQNKSIIMPNLVIEAVKDLELDFMVETLEGVLGQDAAKKAEKKRAQQRDEAVLLRARLAQLEAGAQPETAPAAPTGRGKPPKPKLETLSAEQIREMLAKLEAPL